jgi:DNA-directed RNA polymerase subunit RPC12/RpoP
MTRATYDPIPFNQLMKSIEEVKGYAGYETALKTLKRLHVEYWICIYCGRLYSPFTEHIIDHNDDIVCKNCHEVV